MSFSQGNVGWKEAGALEMLSFTGLHWKIIKRIAKSDWCNDVTDVMQPVAVESSQRSGHSGCDLSCDRTVASCTKCTIMSVEGQKSNQQHLIQSGDLVHPEHWYFCSAPLNQSPLLSCMDLPQRQNWVLSRRSWDCHLQAVNRFKC